MATAAQLAEIRSILNDLNIAARKAKLGDVLVSFGNAATTTTAGAVKQAALVANANVDNSDAGAKINAILASLKAAGIMASA